MLNISDYPFQNLPFSNLFKTYTSNYPTLSDFYETNPFDGEQVSNKVTQFSFQGTRKESADILTSFNARFQVNPVVFDNINRLKKDDSQAVVTGQQLGVYGGPMYTVLKAISAIHLARQLEAKHDRPVIPVFWLADEDHDYDEIRRVQLLEQDEVTHYELPPRKDPLPPVSELHLPKELSRLRENIREGMMQTEYHSDLWELLDDCFTPENTFLQASGQFMATLFSKHGLVLAGSNIPGVKKLTADYLKHSVAEVDKVRDSLNEQTDIIADKFHQQVHLYDSNLFYLEPEGERTKINRNGSGWETATGKQWHTKELLEDIETKPEAFSPNVFLRPIIQDALLPTVGYVAGPGEISYYGQMKEMYRCFNLEMPIIFPRLSATFVEPAIDRIAKELPFELHEYSKRIEDLETGYVDRTEQTDIPGLFSDWKEDIKEVAQERRKQIAGIDATLDKAVGKTTAEYFNELDRLRTKVYRAVKKQDRIQLERIRRIQTNLFADKEMQERGISSIFYMNKYGIDLWDQVLQSLHEDELFDHHKLIKL